MCFFNYIRSFIRQLYIVGIIDVLRATKLGTIICQLLSHVQLFATPWTVAWQASLSMEFFSKNTGVGSHSLLQGIFPTQELNPGLLHCSQILYHLSHEAFFSGGSSQVLLTLKGGVSLKFQLFFFFFFFEVIHMLLRLSLIARKLISI